MTRETYTVSRLVKFLLLGENNPESSMGEGVHVNKRKEADTSSMDDDRFTD
jgi:hypothetical protein